MGRPARSPLEICTSFLEALAVGGTVVHKKSIAGTFYSVTLPNDDCWRYVGSEDKENIKDYTSIRVGREGKDKVHHIEAHQFAFLLNERFPGLCCPVDAADDALSIDEFMQDLRSGVLTDDFDVHHSLELGCSGSHVCCRFGNPGHLEKVSKDEHRSRPRPGRLGRLKQKVTEQKSWLDKYLHPVRNMEVSEKEWEEILTGKRIAGETFADDSPSAHYRLLNDSGMIHATPEIGDGEYVFCPFCKRGRMKWDGSMPDERIWRELVWIGWVNEEDEPHDKMSELWRYGANGVGPAKRRRKETWIDFDWPELTVHQFSCPDPRNHLDRIIDASEPVEPMKEERVDAELVKVLKPNWAPSK